jgi:hypothetical protein
VIQSVSYSIDILQQNVILVCSAGKQVTDDEVEELLSKGTTSAYTSDVSSSSMVIASRNLSHLSILVSSFQIVVDAKINKEMLQEIESRHEDLMKLENSIRELHDMFMDMAMLIENQVGHSNF